MSWLDGVKPENRTFYNIKGNCEIRSSLSFGANCSKDAGVGNPKKIKYSGVTNE